MKMTGVDSFTLNLIDGHANPKIETVYTHGRRAPRAIAHVPRWHKGGTSRVSKEKGLQAQGQQPLDLVGVVEGS
jgi:hypothetical protein